MLMSVAAILTDGFDAVQSETLSLDDVRNESYDPWDDIDARLDNKDGSEDTI